VRLARFEQVRALSREGVSARQIAEETGVARATIYRYLTAASFPEHLPRQPERPIEPYIPYLHERWNAGVHNALTLWREIHAQGYTAGVAQVRRLVMAWRTPPPAPGIPGSPLLATSLPRRKPSPTQRAKHAGSSPSPRRRSQRAKPCT
jgi:transposase